MLQLEKKSDEKGIKKSYFVASKHELEKFNITVEYGDILHPVHYMSRRSNIGKVSINLTNDINLPENVTKEIASDIFEDLIRESINQLVIFTNWDEVLQAHKKLKKPK